MGTAVRIGIVCVIAAGVAACSHTKKVETPAEANSGSEKSEKPEKTVQPKRAASAAKASPKDPMPLANDPLQMLTPKGREQLKEALSERGFMKEGGSVSEGLRKLQTKEGFPETGMPDDDSLLKLGLKPANVVVRVRPAS